MRLGDVAAVVSLRAGNPEGILLGPDWPRVGVLKMARPDHLRRH